MPSESRRRLASKQAQLMQALTDDKPMQGFDANRLHVTAISLQQKRLRTVERVHPCLNSALGESFEELFAQYAKKHPIPAAGPLADGKAFIEYLAESGNLPAHMWRGYFLSTGWRTPRYWWLFLKSTRACSALLIAFQAR
ncbi:MAG: hypothetical protein JST44_03150 [Cyanobacteria bacterium SZAS LIN-5]|nr:hypothetical protein [Cyanobacteria bacterium SZAS LIN-5]